MLKKLLIIIPFIVTLAISLVGCKTNQEQDPYLLSNIDSVRLLEKQDHEACVSFKLNFDRKDNYLNRAYWYCRLSFAKYRLSSGGNVNPMQVKMDLEMRDLITKISLKIASTPESTVIRENQKLDNRDHKKCLAMGFELDTEDQTKIEDYFACRKVLIDEREVVPPYGNLEYLQYKNYSYNIGFVVDQRVSQAIANYNEVKEKYPTCVIYNFHSLNFKRCTAAQDEARKCSAEIEGKKFRREAEEKVMCQKQSYLRFSDSMLKEDDQKKLEIERRNKNSDYYNNQSFSSMGIDGTEFFAPDEIEKKVKKTSQKNNSKAGIYEKFELTKLRQKFIRACQNEAMSRVENFVAEQKKSCDDLAKFEILGED